LESFPDVIERSESSGARISPQQAGRPLRDREERGYLGAMHHAITVTGFDRLRELMAQLAPRELTEVGGPWWELRAQSPVYRDARVAAARDAVRRARDYAGALGSQLTGLVELADARLLADARVPPAPRRGCRSAPGRLSRRNSLSTWHRPGRPSGLPWRHGSPSASPISRASTPADDQGAVVPDRPYLSSSRTMSSRQPGPAVEASANVRSVIAVIRCTSPGGR